MIFNESKNSILSFINGYKGPALNLIQDKGENVSQQRELVILSTLTGSGKSEEANTVISKRSQSNLVISVEPNYGYSEFFKSPFAKRDGVKIPPLLNRDIGVLINSIEAGEQEGDRCIDGDYNGN